MKKLVWLLVLVFSYGISQTNCELCVEQNGFYCGDDESNWTQYSPLGCVPNGLNDLFYLNDGWEDCVDASDEEDTIPTTIEDCQSYVIPCDTIYIIDTLYIEIPVIEYIDCITNLPCEQIGINEIFKLNSENNKLFNLEGKEIYNRNGFYIEDGKVKYKIK